MPWPCRSSGSDSSAVSRDCARLPTFRARTVRMERDAGPMERDVGRVAECARGSSEDHVLNVPHNVVPIPRARLYERMERDVGGATECDLASAVGHPHNVVPIPSCLIFHRLRTYNSIFE